ncbi:hypothetical protein ACFPIK_14165 [Algoriphagus aquatilis]|uniref:Uncharacterized protein n=1 Tax=Algoriphagus aquatilis TaxID=490186 RepID=A0ABW0BY79_9BACT
MPILELDLENLLNQIESKKTLRSGEIDKEIKALFNRHFSSSETFLEDYYYQYKNSSFAFVWYEGMLESEEDRLREEESSKFTKCEFIRHFLSLAPHVNYFIGEKSTYRNKPESFSNLAFYFLSKLSEIESEDYFHYDWILFAEGIQIGNKLKEDLKKYLIEKEFVEQDLHQDLRISYKGRLFIEEKMLSHG